MRKLVLSAILFLIFGNTVSSAQNTTSTISGRVVDIAGAVIPNVQIILFDIDHGGQRTIETDEKGAFQFSGLMAGIFNLRIEKSGFTRYDRAQMNLTAGQTLNLDIKLASRETTDYIGIIGEPNPLQLDEAKISRTYSAKELNEIPVQADATGLSFQAQAKITPGVVMTSNLNAPIAVSGQRPVNNSYSLDSVSLNDSFAGNLVAQLHSREAIAEFEIITHNAKAEYGRNSGGILNLVSKSGANRIYGSAYEYHNNSALESRNFFETTKAPHHVNLAGFTIGAPIKRDKIFVFANYEMNRGRGNAPVYFQGLTESERTLAVPAVKALVDLYPRIPASTSRQFSLAAPSIFNQSSILLRGDMALTIKQHLMMRVNRINTQQQLFGAGNLLTSQASNKRQNLSATVQHTYVPAPTILNEFIASYSRLSAMPLSLQNNLLGNSNISGVIGLLRVTGLSEVGIPAAFNENRVQNNYQLNDNFAWVRGAHYFKFGSSLHKIQINDSTIDNTFFGQLTFHSISDFLAGKPASYARNFGDPNVGLRRTEWHSYMQDDWRAKSNLTINIGWRYELNTAPREAKNRIAVKYLLKTDTNNYAPRFGFAWTPGKNAKTVLHGGYGIFFNALEMSFLGLAKFNAPLMNSFTQANPLLSNPLGSVPNNLPNNLVIPATNTATPYAQHWNFTVEQEVAHHSALSISYVGTQGNKLTRARLPNGGENLPQALRPDASVGVVTRLETSASSNFHALQVDVYSKRYSKFEFRVGYTWSKFIDDVSVLPTTNVGIERNAVALNENNLRLERSVSDFDFPHIFSFSALWQIPFKEKNRWLGGWKLASISTLASGRPYTLYSGTNNLQGVNNNRPFGRNTQRGDSLLDWNVSLTKDFMIAGDAKFQLRTEFFNVFNMTNFNAYDGVLSSPNFGRALSAYDPRRAQIVGWVQF